MQINTETALHLMKAKGLTQAELAKCAKISVRTISRTLGGDAAPNENSVRGIARALGTTPEALAAPLDDQRRQNADKKMETLNFHRQTFYLSGATSLNYALVERRYGLSANSLFDAAPVLLALLAEMSLAARRRRLEDYKAAFGAAMAMAPKHLHRAFAAGNDFDDACDDEEVSLAANDLSGSRIDEEGWTSGDSDTGDLFVAFLRNLSEGIDPKVLEFLGGTATSIDHNMLQGDLERLTNGDEWAKFALEHRHARIRDIPAELSGDDRAIQRAAWLVAQIPDVARKAREVWLGSLGDIEI